MFSSSMVIFSPFFFFWKNELEQYFHPMYNSSAPVYRILKYFRAAADIFQRPDLSPDIVGECV